MDKIIMNYSSKYITKEYKVLLKDTAFVLSIVLFAVTGVNAILTIIAPTWPIRIFTTICIICSILSGWLLYTAVENFIDLRDQMVTLKWVTSYICLFIGMLPAMLFIYLNLDWELLATYGIKALSAFFAIENFILPIALLLLISLIFWTLTILLYKNSYTTYQFITKKKKIYG
ncbi:MAG: hypothetical protein ACI3ZQ_03610 [Candidatus Cryptobacteroides sp.]